METGAGPHPLRLFVCLIPLCLALLLGPGRPGTAEEGKVGCAWEPEMPKIRELGRGLGDWSKDSLERLLCVGA